MSSAEQEAPRRFVLEVSLVEINPETSEPIRGGFAAKAVVGDSATHAGMAARLRADLAQVVDEVFGPWAAGWPEPQLCESETRAPDYLHQNGQARIPATETMAEAEYRARWREFADEQERRQRKGTVCIGPDLQNAALGPHGIVSERGRRRDDDTEKR